MTTLLQAKNSRIPNALGICSDSPKFVAYLNEAVERLLPRGKWKGTYGRFTIAAQNGVVSWPREIETVEGLDICGGPIPIRNEWFEFVLAGPGFHREMCGSNGPRCDCRAQMYDRGMSPLFADIEGVKRLKVYIDNAADVGKVIFFKGKDANGNKIYQPDGTEGFSVTMANPFIIDGNDVTEIYGVIKAETLGAVRVYQYTVADTTQSLIAVYEPDETNPSYRRSKLPNFGNPPPATMTIIAMAKFAFRPVQRDTDFLLIGCLPALKEMCVAIKMQECEKLTEAEVYEARAIRELENELESFLGDNGMPTLQVQNASSVGMPVENLI